MDISINFSLLKEFFDKNIAKSGWASGQSDGKPPLKWFGVKVHEWDISHEHEPEFYKYTMWVMPSGKLVIEFEEIDYSCSLPDGEFHTHRKLRIVHNLDDVWSIATKPGEVWQLTEFLRQCGTILGDETIFWKVVEGDPFPF